MEDAGDNNSDSPQKTESAVISPPDEADDQPSNDNQDDKQDTTAAATTIQPDDDDEEEEEEEEEEKDTEDQNLIRLALHKSPFFTCLDDEQVERFIEVAKLKRYAEGQSIILEGCVDENEDGEVITAATGGGSMTEAETVRPPSRQQQQQQQEKQINVEEEQGTIATAEGFVLVEEPKDEEVDYDKAADCTADSSIDDDQTSREEIPIPVSSLSENNPTTTTTTATTTISTTQPEEEDSPTNNPESRRYLEPPQPPKSGVPSYIYIIRHGQADVLYSHNNISPASLGRGTLFGEGGFLFGRQHSASILASSSGETLECYVVDATTFRNYVLPSDNMTKLYQKYATKTNNNDDDDDDDNQQEEQEEGTSYYMTMNDFINSCLDHDSSSNSNREKSSSTRTVTTSNNVAETIQDPLAGVRIANTFNILRHNNNSNAQKKGESSVFSQQRISLADFCLFHLLMARPDPEVDITFLLIDERKRGVIYKEDIENFLKSVHHDGFEFDMESDFIHRHFGGGKSSGGDENENRSIRPHQFSQFLVDLRQEIGQQVFLNEVAKNGTPEGYLLPSRFVKVLQKACGWRLPDGIAERMEVIYSSTSHQHLGDIDAVDVSAAAMTRPNNNGKNGLSSSIHNNLNVTDSRVASDVVASTKERRLGAHYFSYCDFLAFQEVLGQLPGICSLIDRACEIKKGPLSPDDFKVANRVLGMGGRLSRRQVDIIFQLFDLDGDGYINRADTVAVAGAEFTQRIDAVAGRQGALTFAPPPNYRHDNEHVQHQQREASFGLMFQNFSLTSIAGAIGVVALAPLDLVKTRLMNERFTAGGKRMYQSSFDCLNVALRSEGYFGLYRGLLPQLIGIAPEKAIKLAVNDLLQQSLVANDSGPEKSGLHYLQEMLAGGCAGACQLLVTNPIEIVKIRMQLQGETARLLKAKGFENPVPQSLTAVFKTLRYSGLFTGARACLLRDIPFGAIYFPTYAFFKENISISEGSSRNLSPADLLLAGTLAGVPASFLTTPADVIKTRLQVVPRPGELRYDGIRDCFTKILEKEGPAAFFRGSAMRVAKISPQFGISLVAYEQLSQLLGVKGFLSPTTVPMDPKDYWEAFPARAINNKTDDADRLLKNLGSNSLRPDGPSQGK